MTSFLEGADERLCNSAGAPIAWPVATCGEKGRRADWIGEHLLSLGIKPLTPSKEKEDCNARALKLDRRAYRRRKDTVEKKCDITISVPFQRTISYGAIALTNRPGKAVKRCNWAAIQGRLRSDTTRRKIALMRFASRRPLSAVTMLEASCSRKRRLSSSNGYDPRRPCF